MNGGKGRKENLNASHLCLSKNAGLPKTYCISRRNFFVCKKYAGIIGVKSSTALRINSRCTWRHREGSQKRIPHRPPPRAQPVAPMRERHCRRPRLTPRGGTDQAPYRAQGQPGGAHGRRNISPRTSQEVLKRPHRLIIPRGCDARPSLLFSPPGHGFSTLDARWKLLI